MRFLARRRFSAIAVLYTSMHLSTMIFLLAWLVGWVFRDCHSVFIGNLLVLLVNAVLRLVFGGRHADCLGRPSIHSRGIVISGFRVYAINGQKLLLPLFIAVLYVPDIVEWTVRRLEQCAAVTDTVYDQWQASRQTYTKDPVIGCVINYSLSKGVENMWVSDGCHCPSSSLIIGHRCKADWFVP